MPNADRGVLRHRAGESLPVRAVAPAPGTAGRAATGLHDHRPGRHGRRTAGVDIAVARVRAAAPPSKSWSANGTCGIVLYLNQLEANFRMLRFASPVHIQIGHGESDKATSVSNQHKAYDLVFVGGDAGRDRLDRALRGFDAAERTLAVGRPQLDHSYPGAGPPRDSRTRVVRAHLGGVTGPALRTGSLASHGVAIIEALVADLSIRVIYRPHARTGYASRKHRDADKAVRAVLAKAGDRHLVDRDGYGWQWDFADACVTDISAVAYDWLPTGKPLVITEPAPTAYRQPSPLLDTLPPLGAKEAERLLPDPPARRSGSEGQLRELAYHYFGDVSAQQSTKRFEDAIERAHQIQRS